MGESVIHRSLKAPHHSFISVGAKGRMKIFVALLLIVGIYFAHAAEETDIEDVEAVSKEVVTMKPTEAPSPRFLPGQTWQPWAQQQQMSGQFLPGQTWQQWAQPQNNYLAGQTWQQWAQPQRSYLAGQTWQPWAQEAMASNEVMQGQHLAGQTWQAWAQPQNSYLSGQTWQPWAQPQNTYLAGQTWQPWAREAAASTSKENENVGAPARLQEFNPDDLLKVQFSPSGTVQASQTGVFPIREPVRQQQLQQQPMNNMWNQPAFQQQQPSWISNMPNPNYPVYYPNRQSGEVKEEDQEVKEDEEKSVQDPSVFMPGAPTWGKSWSPMPGQKPGCFNRCKNRCGFGFGKGYGCRPSCRGGCNLRPNCGRNPGKMVGNTMVCPLAQQAARAAAASNYFPGQTWQQPWVQPSQNNYLMGSNTQQSYFGQQQAAGSNTVQQENQALTQVSASVEMQDDEATSLVDSDLAEELEE